MPFLRNVFFFAKRTRWCAHGTRWCRPDAGTIWGHLAAVAVIMSPSRHWRLLFEKVVNAAFRLPGLLVEEDPLVVFSTEFLPARTKTSTGGAGRLLGVTRRWSRWFVRSLILLRCCNLTQWRRSLVIGPVGRNARRGFSSSGRNSIRRVLGQLGISLKKKSDLVSSKQSTTGNQTLSTAALTSWKLSPGFGIEPPLS